MPTFSRSVSALLIAVATGAALSGCAAPTPQVDGLSVVASTNVYGDIAASIAGDLATVTSIIDSAAQDPHSYEASAQDQLAIAGADVVIENGGGYDPFVGVLVAGSGTEAIVVTAVRAAGLDIEDDHSDEEEGDDHSEDEGDDDGHGHIEGVNEH
ncbi:MAG: metal ABC transporter substrate-binding protein, partial [Microcella sp.]|nr:metal ABC transporter substrate-binding protein [Microcella sp.]